MSKKRTIQNNLSYALRYMFDNYGMNIFLDSQKFLVTLDNLIPTLEEELKLVKFAIEKNAISTILNAHNKRDVDKNFAYLRAKTLLTKNGVAEKGALYIIDCFLYALDWVDDFPNYEDLSDEDFKISEVTSEKEKNEALAKKLSAQVKDNNVKNKPVIELNKKKNTLNSEDVKREDEKIESIPHEEKSLSSVKKESTENKNIEQEHIEKIDMNDDKQNQKTNLKYYLDHNFDEDEYYDYDDYEDNHDSGSIFKKIALILVPIIISGCIGFFVFKNLNTEAQPVVSGVSITTEYQIENGVYVLPINEETDLNVIIHSSNSKELDLSKLSFKVEDDSICKLQNEGKKCTIKGLKEGNTNLVVIYNNEIIDSISLSFKEFVKDSDTDKSSDKENSKENKDKEDTTTKEEKNNNTQNNNNNGNNNNSGSGSGTGGSSTGGGSSSGGSGTGGSGTGGGSGSGGSGTGGSGTGSGSGSGGETGGGSGSGGSGTGGSGTGGGSGSGGETGGGSGSGGSGTGGESGGTTE